MLKKIRVLFLGLVVLAGSACVTPTHASSAQSLYITHIQAASPDSAKDELVIIYNESPEAVDLTGWCLSNKASVKFACFGEHGLAAGYALAPYSHATIVSREYADASGLPDDYFAIIYPVTNQSSGSIVNSADSIRLVTHLSAAYDMLSWFTTIPAGKLWARTQLNADPAIYMMTGAPSDWAVGVLADVPPSQIIEFDNEVPPVDVEEPPAEDPDIEHINHPADGQVYPVINEILPDANGLDDGNEFIELYNPSDTYSINLDLLSLRVGKSLEREYSLSGLGWLEPRQYLVVTSANIPFTLLNTTSAVQVFLNDTPIDTAISYANPRTGEAWAFVGDDWHYVSSPTPGSVNRIDIQALPVVEQSKTIDTRKPCAANQFRNPATGRCKLIATQASSLTACKSGQVRNPETNRCRMIAASTSSLAPCKENQERNPDTNRCRNVVKMANVEYAVKGVTTETTSGPAWYIWAAIGGVIAIIAGYAIWEWRIELKKLGLKIRAKFAKSRS